MTREPKFGLMAGGEPPFATVGQIVTLAERAEKDGYDSLWVPDHLVDIDGSMADPWSIFGYLSATTRNIDFYSAVTDYQKVHPAKLAQVIATLDELSRGRITLGIGTGEKMNNAPFGVTWEEPPVRVEKLGEYIRVMRLLWNSSPRSPASFAGRHFVLDGAWLDQQTVTKPSPRICVGSMGSRRMLRLIGRQGDGWLPTLMTPDIYREKLRVIDESARKAGRNPDEIEHAYWLYVVASDDPRVLAEFTASFKAIIATLVPWIATTLGGVELPPTRLDTNFQRLVVSSQLVKELESQAQTIPDDVVSRVCAIGSSDAIIDHIEKAVAAGAQHFCLAVTRGKPDDNMRVLREKVLPYFRRVQG